MSAAQASLAVGQTLDVDVLVKDAPAVYGADMRLAFDPAVLEVVDADAAQPGSQLLPRVIGAALMLGGGLGAVGMWLKHRRRGY